MSTEQSRLLVIDVDIASGGMITLHHLVATGAIDRITPTIRTANGLQLVYLLEDQSPLHRTLGSGVNVHSDAQHVLIPPSTHHAGAVPRWLSAAFTPGQMRLKPAPEVVFDPHFSTIDEWLDADRITIRKIVDFFRAWLRMLREGAVPQSVAEQRAQHCLTKCQKITRGTDGKVYCGQCGCGQREFAAMWVEGKPLDGRETTKLFMGNPCPRPEGDPLRLAPSPGSGSLASVGGRRHQWKMLMRAAIDECKRSGVSVRKFMRALRAERRTEATS